jgi:hypothetical protein
LTISEIPVCFVIKVATKCKVIDLLMSCSHACKIIPEPTCKKLGFLHTNFHSVGGCPRHFVEDMDSISCESINCNQTIWKSCPAGSYCMGDFTFLALVFFMIGNRDFKTPAIICSLWPGIGQKINCTEKEKYCPEKSFAPISIPAGHKLAPLDYDGLHKNITACQVGRYCSEAVEYECPPNTHACPIGQGSPIVLEAGKYLIPTNHSIQLCESGQYCKGGVRHACAAGTHSNLQIGSSYCLTCQSGYVSPNQSSACTQCDAGTFETDLKTCSPCQKGTASSQKGELHETQFSFP